MARAELPGGICGVVVGIQFSARRNFPSKHAILGYANRSWMFWGMGSGEERTGVQDRGSTQAELESECGHMALWPWGII